MKSKALTYIMLIVVGIIWYQVFFRVKSNFAGEETLISEEIKVKRIALREPDTFALNASYRDPFGSQNINPVIENPDFMTPTPPVRPPVAKKDIWPKFKYYGILKKTSSKEPLTIINIDGMQFNLRKNESVFDNFVLRQIYRDSVVFQHGKEKRTFYKY